MLDRETILLYILAYKVLKRSLDRLNIDSTEITHLANKVLSGSIVEGRKVTPINDIFNGKLF